jgi:hypothetical protein
MDKKNNKQKMANKTATTNSSPSAWIVNSNDRGRKSIKNGKVYLQDKEEFQIELYNPLQKCVLADIKLNGNSISKSGLVLNPGQRFYLDCFIDDKKKFIFNTYDVDNTEETKKAIENNGLLEVFFYRESVVNLDNWSNKFNQVIIEKYYPTWYPYYPSYPWGNVYYGTNTAGSIDLSNLKTTTDSFYCSSIGGSTNISATNNLGYTTRSNTSIETGRIEKGDKSKQKFESVDMDFETYFIASTILQILPESRRPIETKELKVTKNIVDVKVPKGLDNNIELIQKLAHLHKEGILTDEEFTTKKAELLSRI